ncbi:TPA_asm: hypothetical protein CBHJFHIM_00054 [Methanobrevibacter gottschalkii virus vir075]|uniref:Uncharacterized protein n=1 Tax=Methanobrevibacter gottschalkii TaxID=190974 RepID=A0A1H7IAB6_9EURY|nr:Ig-like domain repeat protein [Methanobrevibacter gottschalkii]SEK59446.1 hypothetical protein SAMN05216439_1186 [Methanobrevibacter gottschalkii]
MVLTVVLLDHEENFINFLNTDLISLEETCERGKLRSLDVVYSVSDFESAKKTFKMGNKLYISGDKNLTDCLYVINTSIERDYYAENSITFEAEESLVELNYVPLFSQHEATTANGFQVTGDGVITLDRNALGYWFGEYFNIGIIQDLLNDKLLKINPKSTMTLIDLLRFIEEETSNVFITRYEKDAQENIIHRYLDFLNPNDSDKSWEVVIDYDYPIPEEPPSVNVPSDEEIQGENTITPVTPVNRVPVSDLMLRLISQDSILFEETAENIGFDNDYTDYEITLKYNKPLLNITVLKEIETDDVLTSNTDNQISVQIDLPNDLELQLYDSTNNRIVFKYLVNPTLGVIQDDILELGRNTKNIHFELNETDSYKGIAPILTSEDLTHTQLNQVIQDWVDLEVEKGSLVPMIVQKINTTTYPSIPENNPNTYWRKTVKNTNAEGVEYFKATAYWYAPFNKKGGEIFVADDTDTGVEYDKIFMRPDLELDKNDTNNHVKIGTVETSDTDKYAIFNDVCMKLKDKRNPVLNIDVDVANYKNGLYNNYNIFDKVYVKIPTFEQLVLATVSKTVKNAHNIGVNSIELSNYEVNTKTIQNETTLSAENITVEYPKKVEYKVKLTDDEGNGLSGKYVSVTLLKTENGTTSYAGTTYNRKTNTNGEINLSLEYKPGEYQLEANFGGDTEYESSTITTYVTVTGVYYSKTSQKIKKENLKWSKYGHSPKGKYVTNKDVGLKDSESKGDLIIAIGKAVTAADKRKYGNKFIETVFEKKCAYCNSDKLYWGWEWAKKSDTGYFKPTKTTETGAKTGRIICAKCGASYDVLGQSGNKKLTITKASKKSSKSRAVSLKNGKLTFGVLKKVVSKKDTGKNKGNVIPRSTFPKTQTGKVESKVKSKAKSIVGGKTGVSAVKEIATWISKNIKTEDRIGFYQKPSRTLSRKKGNDACKTDLLFHMCDAAGVQEAGIGVYYVYNRKVTKSKKKTKSKRSKKKTSHVFAKINGTWVDTCKSSPWGHYQTGFGAVKNATLSRYPILPFNRKY